MQYDYNSKKSATATVKMPSLAPWSTRQVLLSGTATTPDKDITGMRGVRAPNKTLGSQVDAAAGVKVNQVVNRPALVREDYPAQMQPLYGLPGMGLIDPPRKQRALGPYVGTQISNQIGDLFVSPNSTLLLLAAIGATWWLTKGR